MPYDMICTLPCCDSTTLFVRKGNLFVKRSEPCREDSPWIIAGNIADTFRVLDGSISAEDFFFRGRVSLKPAYTFRKEILRDVNGLESKESQHKAYSSIFLSDSFEWGLVRTNMDRVFADMSDYMPTPDKDDESMLDCIQYFCQHQKMLPTYQILFGEDSSAYVGFSVTDFLKRLSVIAKQLEYAKSYLEADHNNHELFTDSGGNVFNVDRRNEMREIHIGLSLEYVDYSPHVVTKCYDLVHAAECHAMNIIGGRNACLVKRCKSCGKLFIQTHGHQNYCEKHRGHTAEVSRNRQKKKNISGGDSNGRKAR